jgi:hypothetical protein
MKKQLCYILSFVWSVTSIIACKNNVANNCKQIAPQHEGVLLIGKDTFDTKVWQGAGYKYQFAEISVNASLDTLLQEMTGLDIDTGSALATLVLYINKPAGSAIANHTPVNRQDIMAAGLYIKHGKEMRYRFYRNDVKVFNLLPGNNKTVKSVSSNFIMEIYKTNLSQGDTVSALCITNNAVLF